jgi:hypothetical protein
MENTFQIKVFEQLGETLITRSAAVALFELVKQQEAKIVDFDFDMVLFMSRSFADQFHKERLKINMQSELRIQICNAEVSVREMLLTVEQTQKKKNRFYSEIPVFNFSNEDRLLDYMLSI